MAVKPDQDPANQPFDVQDVSVSSNELGENIWCAYPPTDNSNTTVQKICPLYSETKILSSNATPQPPDAPPTTAPPHGSLIVQLIVNNVLKPRLSRSHGLFSKPLMDYVEKYFSILFLFINYVNIYINLF